MATWTSVTGLLPLHQLPLPPGCSLAQLLRLPTTDDEQTAYMWTSFIVSMEHLVLHYSQRCTGTWCPCQEQRQRRRAEREAALAQHLDMLSQDVSDILREFEMAAAGALGEGRADPPAHAADDGVDDDDGEAIGDDEGSYEGDDYDGSSEDNDSDDDVSSSDSSSSSDDDDQPVAAPAADSGRSGSSATAMHNINPKQYLDYRTHREQVLYLG